MKEVWKDIAGFEGLYQVSNFGRVKSFPRNGTQVKTPHILCPSTTTSYALYRLSKNDKSYYKKGHRLVAQAFLPNPEGKPHINHIDGNRLNNRVDNLEWCTPSENIIHCYWTLKTGTGFVNKEVYQCDSNGKIIRRWSAIKIAARALGIFGGDIGRCCAGRRHTAGGFKWKYVNEEESHVTRRRCQQLSER